MRIDDVIAELRRIRKAEGNIEVTCTGSLLREDENGRSVTTNVNKGDVFETTADNLIVHTHPTIGKCVRVLQ